jgi:hypothetical protein
MSSYEETTIIQNIHEAHTFSTEKNINFKLKDYSTSYDDVTVRMIGKKNSDFASFLNKSVPEPEH